MNRAWLTLTITLATAASAQPKPEGANAEASAKASALVQRNLIQPLTAKEERRSRFSRAIQPARARRVRVLEQVPQLDDAGQQFLSFAIDERHGSFGGDELGDDDSPERVRRAWQQAALTGCVYLGSETVFVRRGDRHFAASLLLGKKTEVAPPHTCQAREPTLAAVH